jgi:tetratricopeptide (TPR) repeat protein
MPARRVPKAIYVICHYVLAALVWTSSTGQAQNASLEGLFQQAQAASREGKYTQAENLYRRILTADPGSVATRVNLGLACYWQGRNPAALAEFEKALRAALLFSGLASLNLGEYGHAQEKLLAAARVNDMDPLLYWALGSLAMIHGDSNAAVPLLERSVALDPHNARTVWLLGQAYARLAYRKEVAPSVPADYAGLVEKTVKWMQQNQANSALLHVFRGDVLAARNLGAEALSEYQRALQLDASWPDIHLLMGNLFDLLGQREEAVREFQTQLKAFPGDPRALLQLGVAYSHAGNYGAALPYLREAATRDTDNYETHYQLGAVYVNLAQYMLAVPELERASHINPGKSDTYYLLFRAYRVLGKKEESARALEQFNRLKWAPDRQHVR